MKWQSERCVEEMKESVDVRLMLNDSSHFKYGYVVWP